MPSGIRKSGVRVSNPPTGRAYYIGEYEFSLDALQPSFTSSFVVDDTTLRAVFPSFTTQFEVRSDTLQAVFPPFTASFTVLPGGVATLAAEFPAFDFTASLSRGWVLQAVQPAFTAQFLADVYAEFDMAVVFPVWTFRGTLLAPTTSATAPSQVWVLNADTAQHSTYTNWQANAYGVFNGKEFIALPDGLYELTGTTDNGTAITSKVYWPPSDFGTDKQQRVDAVYVRLRGSQTPIKIVATTDEVERRIYTGDMTGFPLGIHPKRILFTRNLKGNLWQIGFENTTGGDFALAEIEVITVPESRRLK